VVNVRRLEPEEIVTIGDLVTVNDTPESGYRELTGRIGIKVGQYCYPIYRSMDIEKTYIKIKDGERGPGLTLDPEEAKAFVDEIVGNCDGDPYTFSAISMTEKQFNDLPEFTGF